MGSFQVPVIHLPTEWPLQTVCRIVEIRCFGVRFSAVKVIEPSGLEETEEIRGRRRYADHISSTNARWGS